MTLDNNKVVVVLTAAPLLDGRNLQESTRYHLSPSDRTPWVMEKLTSQ